MQKIEHKVKHYYQPTANSCGYTALSILLSFYGVTIRPEELLEQVPQPEDENGVPTGSVTAQLATWCLCNDHPVDFYAFDCEILDLSWAELDRDDMVKKLKKVRAVRDVPGLGGKHWSKIYIDAYIDMLQAGAELHIEPHVTSKLLYSILKKTPVYVNFCATTVNNEGRLSYPDNSKREHVPDDIYGKVGNHSVVIYGHETNGDFLVADPWHGRRVIDLETMLCGITAAQIECDNQCFQIVS